MLALALEANENKATWRDVQHIVVNSARITDPSDNDWKTNGAGFHFNHKYGFGVLDAGAITKVAATWQNVGAQVVSTFGPYSVSSLIPTASNFKNGLTLGSTIGNAVLCSTLYLSQSLTNSFFILGFLFCVKLLSRRTRHFHHKLGARAGPLDDLAGRAAWEP